MVTITMNNQQTMIVTADAKKPDSCVTAGIARIPAPTCDISLHLREMIASNA